MGNGQELLKKVQKLKREAQRSSTMQKFRIWKSSEEQLFLRLPDDTDLGYSSEKLAGALKAIYNQEGMEFEAFAGLGMLEETIRRSGKASEAAIRVDINVYGPQTKRDEVGRRLSNASLFLQDPDHCRPNCEYSNPHLFEFSEVEESEEEDSDNDNEFFSEPTSSGDNNFTQEITEVFNSLRRDQGLQRVQGNDKVTIPLFPYV